MPQIRCSSRPTRHRSSEERLGALLHPSFREFGRSGAEYSREAIVSLLLEDKAPPSIWAQDFALAVLSEDLALLTYRSAQIGEDGALHRHTHRSSLWQRTERGWQMRFHQGTPTSEFEKHAG
ncbi:MAG: DUF4440 domain-containing protein [Betaproteobacteria bacterium]|nr:DUF4440 domain-containing protein [Betaproteobacteria bacterium]